MTVLPQDVITRRIVKLTEIFVSCSHTSYAGETRFNLLELKDLKKMHREIKSKEKVLGFKVVNKYKTLKKAKELYLAAVSEYKLYLADFNAYFEMWNNIDLDVFSKEDVEATYPLRNKLRTYFHGNTSLSQYNACVTSIRNIDTNISYPSDHSGTTYYL